MKPGEQFEIESCKFLNNTYASNSIKFQLEGGMDSTKSDIAFIKDNKLLFYIEAKDSLAQSGQFVLLPDENKHIFIFSPRNHSTPNEMTNIIISYMNDNFKKYHSAGTAGEHIDIDTNVFSNWIIGHYKDKNAKYVITRDNDFIIFPLEKFGQYFKITANYRVKKSGSTTPAKKDYAAIKQLIQRNYKATEFIQKAEHLCVKITNALNTDRFILGKYTYQLSKLDTNEYEIRRLSNTYNMNVIFTISLIKSQDTLDLNKFLLELN